MPNLEGSRARADALRVPCRHCKATVGSPCMNAATGQPLRNLPAHPIRVSDSEKAQK